MQSSSSGVQDVDLAPISQPVAQASSLHPRPEGWDSDDELPPEEFHDVGCILADFQVQSWFIIYLYLATGFASNSLAV